jgi:uncharacterized metal-binding protein YceD (DUF177 family)
VSKPNFVVHAADLERGPRSLTWVLPEAWLKSVLADTTATPVGDGKLEAELSKNGNEVMVRGHADVSIDIPCVVTLEPLRFELKPEIFLLLVPDPAARPPRTKAPRPGTDEGAAKAKPVRPAKPRPPKGKGGWTEDPELSGNEAARDTFDGERVVLDDFVREFIVLELPMYPRRSDLPSSETPAIGAPSSAAETSPARVDPRLLPLANIASRLREQQKKE